VHGEGGHPPWTNIEGGGLQRWGLPEKNMGTYMKICRKYVEIYDTLGIPGVN